MLCGDLSAQLHALSSCLLFAALDYWKPEMMQLQINIPTRTVEAGWKDKAAVHRCGIHAVRLNFIFDQLSFLPHFCPSLGMSLRHYIRRPADHMLAAGLSQFNTDILASSAFCVYLHGSVCVQKVFFFIVVNMVEASGSI